MRTDEGNIVRWGLPLSLYRVVSLTNITMTIIIIIMMIIIIIIIIIMIITIIII